MVAPLPPRVWSRPAPAEAARGLELSSPPLGAAVAVRGWSSSSSDARDAAPAVAALPHASPDGLGEDAPAEGRDRLADAESHAHADAAVAAASAGADGDTPPQTAEREQRTHKDTASRANSAGWWDLAGENIPVGEGDTGNFGWFLQTVGELSANEGDAVRRGVLKQLRCNPAQVLLCCEAQSSVEQELQKPGIPAPEAPPAEHSGTAVAANPSTGPHRAEYQYLCLRGREDKSLLIGVRTNVARQLRSLFWEKNATGPTGQKLGPSCRAIRGSSWLKSRQTNPSRFSTGALIG